MRTKNLLFKIVAIIFALVCFGSVAIAQKLETNMGKAEKSVPFTDFKNTDVGQVSKAGIVTSEKNVIQIIAGGADIWGTRDQFHFCYVLIKGDFELSTQVLSLTAANAYTKAGIMARVNLDDNSQHVFYQVFPKQQCAEQKQWGL